jgi:hypothetical protein
VRDEENNGQVVLSNSPVVLSNSPVVPSNGQVMPSSGRFVPSLKTTDSHHIIDIGTGLIVSVVLRNKVISKFTLCLDLQVSSDV